MAKVAHIDADGIVVNVVEGPADMARMPPPPDGLTAVVSDAAVMGQHFDGSTFTDPDVSLDELVLHNQWKLGVALSPLRVSIPGLGSVGIDGSMLDALRRVARLAAANPRFTFDLPQPPPNYGYVTLNAQQIAALDKAADDAIVRVFSIYRNAHDGAKSGAVKKLKDVSRLWDALT